MTCLSKNCVKKSRPKNILIGETSFHFQFLIEETKMILRIFHAHFYLGTYISSKCKVCLCVKLSNVFYCNIYAKGRRVEMPVSNPKKSISLVVSHSAF